MWKSAFFVIHQLLNSKMHGETLKFVISTILYTHCTNSAQKKYKYKCWYYIYLSVSLIMQHFPVFGWWKYAMLMNVNFNKFILIYFAPYA